LRIGLDLGVNNNDFSSVGSISIWDSLYELARKQVEERIYSPQESEAQAMTTDEYLRQRCEICGKCGYCGTVIKFCAAGEYCPNKECGYIDGYYRPSFRPSPKPKRIYHESEVNAMIAAKLEAAEDAVAEVLGERATDAAQWKIHSLIPASALDELERIKQEAIYERESHFQAMIGEMSSAIDACKDVPQPLIDAFERIAAQGGGALECIKALARLEEAIHRVNVWPPLGALRTEKFLIGYIEARNKENLKRVRELKFELGERERAAVNAQENG